MRVGSLDRVRPKLMTVFTMIIGLIPVMLGTETGSEIMKRIATPMVGGLVTSAIHTLIMIPALYAVVHAFKYRKELKAGGDGTRLLGIQSRVRPIVRCGRALFWPRANFLAYLRKIRNFRERAV